MQILNTLVSALIQLTIFSIPPIIYWIIKGRKEGSFFDWVGIKNPVIKNKNRFIIFSLGTFIAFMLVSVILVPKLAVSDELATSKFSGLGSLGILPAFIYAFIQTGLSEEILFRGFLGKVLIKKFGFNVGNTVQGTLFGLIHGIMLISRINLIKAIAIIAFTGVIGYVFGYLNEKESGGSILPSWIMHGLSNFLTAIAAMYNLILKSYHLNSLLI